MNEIAYGTKYESSKGLSRVEVAKLIRADIKAAVASGELPAAKYSVTCKSFSGGGSIDISYSKVADPTFRLLNEERVRFDIEHGHMEFTRLPLYSERAQEITKRLDGILAAYNYDGSDTQTDYFNVRFYGHAKPEWQWESIIGKAETAAVAAAMEAESAAPAPVAAQVSWVESLGG